MLVEIQRDGLTLRGELDIPQKESYDLVIAMHGFTGNINNEILVEVKQQLLENNMAVLRINFNGHGNSDGKLEDMTVLNEIADGKAILDYVKTLPNINNIYLLGHSQGGVVASMLAGYYPEVFKKVVLLAPAATLKDDAIKGVCMDAVYDPCNIPDTVCVRGDTIGGFYFRIAQILPIYETAALYKGPVKVIHGKADAVVSYSTAIKYHEVYENCELCLLEEADHRFTEPYTKNAASEAVAFLLKD